MALHHEPLLDELRKLIKPKAFSTNVYYCLEFGKKYPEIIPQIGIGWFSDNLIISHSKIFSNFIGISTNSHSYNFRHHNFLIDNSRKNNKDKLKLSYPDIKHWNIYFHLSTCFNKTSTFEEVKKLLIYTKKASTRERLVLLNRKEYPIPNIASESKEIAFPEIVDSYDDENSGFEFTVPNQFPEKFDYSQYAATLYDSDAEDPSPCENYTILL
ncbi:hypothetical protein TRFO_01721 [Tritrichomonas foetus]|uniref:Initiator binding domain-containing protein n=1 Tax=Tritrichomonas foetus TaxID=1144522 RepID=A0A1J4JUC6_9EUKA|nr:hypothetical protein TRFO_01721 [Tritrichomonas foetus]|eukprot:OHT01126.1 hypothetical protein TRFO_01721 [Tritrichomonas foetus]